MAQLKLTSRALLSVSSAVLGLLILAGCGGGGGGGDFVGAANVSLSTSPHKIDSGDRTEVKATISEVNENGIILKFRYPRGLSYVLDSAFLEADGEPIDVSPAVNERRTTNVFLVFFLDRGLFGDGNFGKLTFQLEADNQLADGIIAVDADVDDPLIDNTVEFDIDTPEFGAEAETDIEVTN